MIGLGDVMCAGTQAEIDRRDVEERRVDNATDARVRFRFDDALCTSDIWEQFNADGSLFGLFHAAAISQKGADAQALGIAMVEFIRNEIAESV